MTPNELMYRLLKTPLSAEKVNARTPHGTYTFDITDVVVEDGAVVLQVTEVGA